MISDNRRYLPIDGGSEKWEQLSSANSYLFQNFFKKGARYSYYQNVQSVLSLFKVGRLDVDPTNYRNIGNVFGRQVSILSKSLRSVTACVYLVGNK